jgi:hypothetical protein
MRPDDLIARLIDFVAEHSAWLVTGSLSSMLVGAVLVPALILRIPADYFRHPRREVVSAIGGHPLARVLLAGIKNFVGAIFLVAGLALLFLPGQGLLTLLAGLVIMNYPGKFAFERWLIRRPHVLPALNWLRRRYGRAPLLDPGGEEA